MDPARMVFLFVGLLANLTVNTRSDIVLINSSDISNSGTTTPSSDTITNSNDKDNANTTGALEPADDDQGNTNGCVSLEDERKEENVSTRNDQIFIPTQPSCEPADGPVQYSELFLENFKDQFCGTNLCNEQAGEKCYCDLKCYFYKDCCYLYVEKDYVGYYLENNGNVTLGDMIVSRRNAFLNDTNPLTNVSNVIQCVTPANESRGFWLVNQCPKTYIDVNGIKGRCEHLNYYYYDNLPVDYVINGTYQYSFINVFCALCNGVEIRDIVFWKIEVLCSSNEQRPITPETTTEEILTECPLSYYSLYKYDPRGCNNLLNLIPEPTFPLNPTPDEEVVMHFCESTILPISARNTTYIPTEEVYRNPYCLLLFSDTRNYSELLINDSTIFDVMTCVFVAKENFTNNYRHLLDQTEGKLNGPVDLTVFFNIDIERGVSVELKCDQGKACQTYQIWDCVTKTCRILYCSNNMVPVNGRCVNVLANSLNEFEKPNDDSQNGTHILEVKSKHRLNTSAILTRCTSVARANFMDSECVFVDLSLQNDNYTWRFNVTGFSTGNVTAVIRMLEEQVDCITNMVDTEGPCDDSKEDEKSNDSFGPTNRIDFEVLFRNYADGEQLTCTRNELIVDDSSAFSTDMKHVMFSVYELAVPVERTRWYISMRREGSSWSTALNSSATCASIVLMSGLNCSMVSYNSSEVSMHEDNVTVIISGREFSSGHYFLYDEMVFVCADSVTWEYVDMFRDMKDNSILTYVTSGISIVSLIFAILYHVCDKKLLNIHGLHITALSIVTLLIHVLLVIQAVQQDGVFCAAYAIVLHFLLLNMFTWMNVIGVDMARFFASGNVIAKRSPWRAFRKHVAISLFVTSAFILVALIFEFLTDYSIKPNYGKYDICWLTSRSSIIYFVIVPVGISLLISFISYTMTVRYMIIQAKQAKLVSTTNNKTYFFVYLKLTVILGLTWIVGLIGMFVSVNWFGILHIVLNGLQGLSLLICAVVNKRVIAHIRSKARYLTTDTRDTPSSPSTGHNGRVVKSTQYVNNQQTRPQQETGQSVKVRDTSQIYTIPNKSDDSYESMDSFSGNKGHARDASQVNTIPNTADDSYESMDSFSGNKDHDECAFNESSNSDDVYVEPENNFKDTSIYNSDM